MTWLYEAQQALEKAADCLDDSAFNLSAGRTIVTVNRAYYAIYYCICCLLFTQNISTKTHKGTQQKFSEIFIKTGVFPPNTAQWINNAFDLRQFVDYDLEASIVATDARQVFEQAQQFYDLSKNYFETLLRTTQ